MGSLILLPAFLRGVQSAFGVLVSVMCSAVSVALCSFRGVIKVAIPSYDTSRLNVFYDENKMGKS